MTSSRSKPLRLRVAQAICGLLPPIGGRKLGLKMYSEQRGLADDYAFTVRSQTGSPFHGRTSDRCAHRFSVHGFYDWRLWAVALATCSPGDTIVEVGANIGTETVGFSDIVGPRGAVHAFEPLPSNVTALRSAVEGAFHPNITVFPLAVGAECRRVAFATPPPEHAAVGHVLSGTEGRAHDAPRGTIEVECATLDSVSERLGAASLLTIDAEGFEVQILRGARSYVAAHAPHLVVEANPSHLARAGDDLRTLRAELVGLGYWVYRLGRYGLTKVEEPVGDQLGSNWFCAHVSKLEAVRRIRVKLLLCGLMPCLPRLNPLALACRRYQRAGQAGPSDADVSSPAA